jgi:hypothetical protein
VISEIAFVVITGVLCVAAVFALFGVLHLYMSGGDAIQRDGLRRGSGAPAWSLPDLTGASRSSPPPERPLQLIVFTDHSLKSFPSVVDGLRKLLNERDLEILVLLQRQRPLAQSMLELLGLGALPIVVGSPRLYGRYNVRVTPFVMFVDREGRVRASSLVNHDWQLAKLARLARVPLPGALPSRRKLRRLARVEV